MDQVVGAADRAVALKALSADQRKRLEAFARMSARNTGEDGEDILSAAHVRWMASEEPVQGPEHTYGYLQKAISSIRSNTFRHQRLVQKFEGVRVYAASPDGPDPIDLGADPGASQEDAFFVQQLYDLFKHDSEVQMLILYESEQKVRAEMQLELEWDDKKYDAVRKRRVRMIARWKLEGRFG